MLSPLCVTTSVCLPSLSFCFSCFCTKHNAKTRRFTWLLHLEGWWLLVVDQTEQPEYTCRVYFKSPSRAGSAAAVCYRKFHRRPRVRSYLKPKNLHLELRRFKPVITAKRDIEIYARCWWGLDVLLDKKRWSWQVCQDYSRLCGVGRVFDVRTKAVLRLQRKVSHIFGDQIVLLGSKFN